VKRRLFATTSALGALCLLASAAHAGDEWCEYDPLVVVQTPGGSLVPVYVTTGALGLAHLAAVQLARIELDVAPVGGGTSTKVRISVTVPPDMLDSHFQTRTTASSGPLKTGVVFASAQGFSGQTMQLQFTLAVP
jgi:hypothetical protein